MGQNFTDEELDAGQLLYLAWAKAKKRAAIARLDFRNAWLHRVGRDRHRMRWQQIRDL